MLAPVALLGRGGSPVLLSLFRFPAWWRAGAPSRRLATCLEVEVLHRLNLKTGPPPCQPISASTPSMTTSSASRAARSRVSVFVQCPFADMDRCPLFGRYGWINIG